MQCLALLAHPGEGATAETQEQSMLSQSVNRGHYTQALPVNMQAEEKMRRILHFLKHIRSQNLQAENFYQVHNLIERINMYSEINKNGEVHPSKNPGQDLGL